MTRIPCVFPLVDIGPTAISCMLFEILLSDDGTFCLPLLIASNTIAVAREAPPFELLSAIISIYMNGLMSTELSFISSWGRRPLRFPITFHLRPTLVV